MAQFMADIKGSRGKASRLGSKESGIYSHTRGWNAGIEVIGYVDDEGRDCFEVWTTGGSTAPSNGRRMIGTLIEGLGFGFTA